MLPLRCSRPSISVSKSISFWPSTIARRRSSAWVALISILFIRTPLAAARGRAQSRRRGHARCGRKMHEQREEPEESPWTGRARSDDRASSQRWRARDSEEAAGKRALGHWTQVAAQEEQGVWPRHP